MSTIITRVAFCAECYKANRPQIRDKFVAIGRTRPEPLIHTVEHRVARGFVPHIFQMEIIMGNRVKYFSHCAMNECGIEIKKTKGGYMYEIINDHEGEMSIDDWNALVLFTDSGFRLD